MNERRLEWRMFVKHYGEKYKRIQQLQQLESLSRLQSLEKIQRIATMSSHHVFESLQTYTGSYDAVSIADDEDCVIYCDIPYRNTNGYDRTSKTKDTIDYESFYNWVRNSAHLIFVSEYNMPEDFVPILCVEKTRSFSATQNNKKTCEKLFVHASKTNFLNNTIH